MTLRLLRALPTGALLSTIVFAPAALAEITKTQCVDADTQAQQLRRDEKLIAARAQLKTCTDQACPALVRDDCAQRLDEIDKLQPSLVFDVKDGQGRDLTDVKVTVDGQALVDNLSGAAIPVDPGTRSFTFEVKGEEPVTRQLVLHEGDKARHEKVIIGKVVPPPEVATSDGSTQRTAGVVMGVFGLVGLGVGGVFGGLAASKWSTAQSDCPTSGMCTQSGNTQAKGEETNAKTLAGVSTVGFIAGGVLAAGGIVLYVLAPSKSSKEGKPPPQQGLEIVPAGGPGGAGMTLRGWF
jgi:hypothetical protein